MATLKTYRTVTYPKTGEIKIELRGTVNGEWKQHTQTTATLHRDVKHALGGSVRPDDYVYDDDAGLWRKVNGDGPEYVSE